MLLTALSFAGPAAAEQPGGPRVSVAGLFTSLVLLRSDSDFDPSHRFYDRDGQTEGQAATFLRPDVRIGAGRGLELFYQAELGWNAWSLNDPDQWFPGEESYFVVKHREVWAAWESPGGVRLASGYQHFADPSRLFLDHWAGAVRLDLGVGDPEGGASLLVAQLPDSTFEGVEVREGNFVHDSLVLGFENAMAPLPGLTLDAALYGVGDFRAVDRPLLLTTGLAGARFEEGGLEAWGHVLVQLGSWRRSGVAGVDQTVAAWAAQAGVARRFGALDLSLNALALSPDDDHDGNARLGTFFSSAKNRSRTLILTEDEVRDRYDNLDERVASRWGAFYVGRAGLVVADVACGWQLAPWARPELILGLGMTLNPHNALGNRLVGVEAALRNDFPLGGVASLFVVGQLLVPGGAAAAFVNDVDREATRTVAGLQAGFSARF